MPWTLVNALIEKVTELFTELLFRLIFSSKLKLKMYCDQFQLIITVYLFGKQRHIFCDVCSSEAAKQNKDCVAWIFQITLYISNFFPIRSS